MTQRIRRQASQFWLALSSLETRQAYSSAVVKTGAIIREGGLLVWLLLCLVLVAFDAGVAMAIAAGRSSRRLVGRLGNTQPDAIAADTKQLLLSAGQTGLAATLSQARQQLGLPQKPAATPKTVVPEIAASETAASETAASEPETVDEVAVHKTAASETAAPETATPKPETVEETKVAPEPEAAPAESPEGAAEPGDLTEE